MRRITQSQSPITQENVNMTLLLSLQTCLRVHERNPTFTTELEPNEILFTLCYESTHEYCESNFQISGTLHFRSRYLSNVLKWETYEYPQVLKRYYFKS